MTMSKLSTLLTTAVSLLSRLITLIGRSSDSDAMLSSRFCWASGNQTLSFSLRFLPFVPLQRGGFDSSGRGSTAFPGSQVRPRGLGEDQRLLLLITSASQLRHAQHATPDWRYELTRNTDVCTDKRDTHTTLSQRSTYASWNMNVKPSVCTAQSQADYTPRLHWTAAVPASLTQTPAGFV